MRFLQVALFNSTLTAVHPKYGQNLFKINRTPLVVVLFGIKSYERILKKKDMRNFL